MPFLSRYARAKKIRYFFSQIRKDARILEIGCGSMWVAEYLKGSGCTHYAGIDLSPPADIVGDVLRWKDLGLTPESFDVIIAFEVVEHVDCFSACFELLKPGGKLMLTTPVPRADRILALMERYGLNQKRTSPHTNLVSLRDVPVFQRKEIKIVALLSQWGIFTKEH